MSDTPIILVLVPGTTGSTLVGYDRVIGANAVVWPDVVGLDVDHDAVDDAVRQLKRTDLWPGTLLGLDDPIRPAGYQPFVDFFTAQGFQQANARYGLRGPAPRWGLPNTLTGNLLVTFPYDWRADCTASGALLTNLLSTVHTLYGAGGYDLYLVAHSMGGLVSRACLETAGTGDPWLAAVKGLITLGTPHLGAPLALAAITGQLDGLLPARKRMDTMVTDFVDTSYSASTFQLLPPPVFEGDPTSPAPTRYVQDRTGTEATWWNLLDPGISPAVTDTVKAAAQAAVGPGATINYDQEIGNAKAFFATLDYTGQPRPGKPDLPPYFCVAGMVSGNDAQDTGTTVVSFLCDADAGVLTSYSDFDGDTIVPGWSAGFAGRPGGVAGTFTAAGVDHLRLPSDPGVQLQVASWIGLSPIRSADPARAATASGA